MASVFRQRVLPFGSIAWVTAFLRASLALWAVGNKLLNLTWSAYFDDFLSVSEWSSSKHTDLGISALFSFLGWQLSEGKSVPFSSVCKALGVQLDLNNSKLGSAQVSNIPERVEELTAEISKVLDSGILSRHDGERLRGRLQFATAQLFGRSMNQSMRDLGKHIASGKKNLSSSTIGALKLLRAAPSANEPRQISSKLSNHVRLYVDASYAPGGYSIGGVCVSSGGEVLGFFGEEVPPELVTASNFSSWAIQRRSSWSLRC